MKKALVLLLLLGCTNITQVVSVVEFNNRRPMLEVPEIYSHWYLDTEECFGESNDFSAINWYTATGIVLDGIPGLGIIQYPNDITIKRGFELQSRIVRHEMAHHIVQGNEIHFNNNTRAVCDE